MQLTSVQQLSHPSTCCCACAGAVGHRARGADQPQGVMHGIGAEGGAAAGLYEAVCCPKIVALAAADVQVEEAGQCLVPMLLSHEFCTDCSFQDRNVLQQPPACSLPAACSQRPSSGMAAGWPTCNEADQVATTILIDCLYHACPSQRRACHCAQPITRLQGPGCLAWRRGEKACQSVGRVEVWSGQGNIEVMSLPACMA